MCTLKILRFAPSDTKQLFGTSDDKGKRLKPKQNLNLLMEQVVECVKTRYGDRLDRVVLYGSYARGDFDESSDIDILILVDMRAEDANRIDRDLIRLASRLGLEYDVSLSLEIKDSQTFDAWSDIVPFYRNIKEEGVLLGA